MTQRNRTRVMTPRKRRLWTVRTIAEGLVAASVGTASQLVVNVGTSFTSATDLTLREATVGRSFLNGVMHMIPAATPTNVGISMGLIVAHAGLVATAFPNIALGEGDYFVRDCRQALEVDDNIPASRPLEPHGVSNGGGSVMIDGKSKRTVKRVGDTVFFVVQKDAAVEQDIQIDICLTTLWLY